MTPLAFGSDLAGSIRVPCGFVGVYGLRPTVGVTSFRGHLPPLPGEINGIRNMAVIGPMARSVGDLELALRVIAGPHGSDYTLAPLKPLADPPRTLSSLRVAYVDRFPPVRVSQEVQAALERFVGRLRAAGATVVHAAPRDLSYEQAWESWGALVGMQGGYDRSNTARWFGRLFAGSKVRDVPMHRRIIDPISVPKYMQVLAQRDRQINALERFLSDYDAWIVPTAATVAFVHHERSGAFGAFPVYDVPLDVDGDEMHYFVATQAYTTVLAFTESPVVALPIEHTASGLPVGVQVVGRRFDDMRLLRVAALLGQASRTRPFPLQNAAQRQAPAP
jgi:amidase